MGAIVDATRKQAPPLELSAVTFHDPIRAVIDKSLRRRGFKTEFSHYAALEGAPSAPAKFFTSSRSYFVSLGEDILEEPSQAWI